MGYHKTMLCKKIPYYVNIFILYSQKKSILFHGSLRQNVSDYILNVFALTEIFSVIQIIFIMSKKNKRMDLSYFTLKNVVKEQEFYSVDNIIWFYRLYLCSGIWDSINAMIK